MNINDVIYNGFANDVFNAIFAPCQQTKRLVNKAKKKVNIEYRIKVNKEMSSNVFIFACYFTRWDRGCASDTTKINTKIILPLACAIFKAPYYLL
jgi:hypothetical protein